MKKLNLKIGGNNKFQIRYLELPLYQSIYCIYIFNGNIYNSSIAIAIIQNELTVFLLSINVLCRKSMEMISWYFY